MNSITNITTLAGRTCVTPEDVEEALRANAADIVRRDLLAVMAGQTQFSLEDSKVCALVAYRGTIAAAHEA